VGTVEDDAKENKKTSIKTDRGFFINDFLKIIS